MIRREKRKNTKGEKRRIGSLEEGRIEGKGKRNRKFRGRKDRKGEERKIGNERKEE